MREVETDHGRARIDLVLGRKRFGRESENGGDDDAGACDSRDERSDKKRRSARWRVQKPLANEGFTVRMVRVL